MTQRRALALLFVSVAIAAAACATPLRAGAAGAATAQPAPPVAEPRPERPVDAATPPPAATDGAAIPAYAGYVTDLAGVLDEPARAKLEAFLDQLQKKTGAQFAVLTVQSTAPWAPAEYKVRVFQAWGIGGRDADDGLLMLVAIAERRVEFETGYGLEGTLPDGLQSRIVRREIAPAFRAGDYAAGITAGVLRCAERIAAKKGVTLEWDGRELRYSERRGRRAGPLAALLLFLVIALVVSAASRSAGGPPGPFGGRRRRHGWDAGWGGGWGGGLGGGWGGGGLGGGGGGGGSFGGFGGGGSGGGGGGGSW